ncbi:SRPBCC domain-containing protein [Algibacter marinivivus]|uniref:SRPBCC domain-containing protein n=1 Tax=Algibacter marinivivus TaxID=2100723 RepID=A0A2U2X504_9FLAO|nr:SRPBCC domain-containing protein [Algibacter marinivivus]PWH82834.1 SRPBCC domain-containing protein [Algibacter marinivivus]
MSYNIYHNLKIKASVNEVFDAVSQPEHLNNWWTLKSSGTPKLDSEYNLNFTDEYNWYCKVSKVELNRTFHLKMTKSDKDWNPTTFGFDLESIEDGTMLKFSHVNWLEANHHFKHSSFCWAMLLNGLKNYLEKGIIIPFEERN